MIIFLSELQKEHLSLIHKHSTQVLIDFCKLSLDYINNGVNVNNKKYTIAAEKLDVSVSAVQNLVHALVYLIVEGCKHNLSESDLKSSLAIAGFSSEQQEVLAKLHNSKKNEFCDALHLLHQKESTYQDFTWRFEIQVASRSCMEEMYPMITMDFVIMTPKNLGQNKDDRHERTAAAQGSRYLSPVHINSSIQNARAASHCQNIINHILVHCDLPNLLHLTNELDLALKESKSQHVRKVQRALV